ncbi:hypothetical protein MTO96_015559 [Rhipicephalus appendiculatus]
MPRATALAARHCRPVSGRRRRSTLLFQNGSDPIVTFGPAFVPAPPTAPGPLAASPMLAANSFGGDALRRRRRPMPFGAARGVF